MPLKNEPNVKMLLQGSDQREDGFRNSATSRMGLIETIGKK